MLLHSVIVMVLAYAVAKIWSLDRKVRELSSRLPARTDALPKPPAANATASGAPSEVASVNHFGVHLSRPPSRLGIMAPKATAEDEAASDPAPSGQKSSSFPVNAEAAGEKPSVFGGLSESLMARWPVWLGGLSLLIAGFFIVQYSIDNFSLSIGARIAGGLAFGALLVLAGELLKRRSIGVGVAGDRASNIPAALVGSGVSAVFAAFWASYGYDVLPPPASFAGMAAAGFFAMGLSFRHGSWLAGAGMAAAYVPPLLMMEDMPVPYLGLLVYLLVVCATVLAASIRFGGFLAVIGTAGAMAMPLAWVVREGFEIPGDGIALMSYAAAVLGLTMARTAVSSVKGALCLGIDFAFLWVAFTVLGSGGADWSTVIFTVLFICATAIASRMDPGTDFRSFVALLWSGKISLSDLYGASGALMLALVLIGSSDKPGTEHLPNMLSILAMVTGGSALGLLARGGALFLPVSAATVLLGGLMHADSSAPALLTVSLSTAFLVIVTLAAWKETLMSRKVSRQSPQVAVLALLATVVPAASVIVHMCYNLRIDIHSTVPSGPLYGGIALAFAVASLALGELLTRSGLTGKLRGLPVAFCDGSAIALVAAMVLVSAHRGEFATALALAGVILALPSLYRSAIVLRHAPSVLGAAALFVLFLDPTVVGSKELHVRPEAAAAMALAYLAVFTALAVSCVLLARKLRDRALRLTQALATVSAFVAFIALLRYAVHGPAMASGGTGLLEQAAYVVFSLGASYVLCFLGLKERSPVFKGASLAAGFAGMASAAVTLGMAWNPAFNGQAIEAGPVVLALAAGYLVPGTLAAAIAASAAGLRFGLPAMPGQPRQYVWGMAALSGYLLFWWATLMTRFAFMGAAMAAPYLGQAEMLAYSAVWLAMGGSMLLAGISTGRRFLRIASAPVVMLVIAKVFLIDMSSLEGLYRAFSFMGLGLSLIAVGIFYQRMLARHAS